MTESYPSLGQHKPNDVSEKYPELESQPYQCIVCPLSRPPPTYPHPPSGHLDSVHCTVEILTKSYDGL